MDFAADTSPENLAKIPQYKPVTAEMDDKGVFVLMSARRLLSERKNM